MKKKKRFSPMMRMIFIFTIFIVIITGLRLLFYFSQHAVEQPHVEAGVFDLTTYEFPYESSMVLDGDWHFIPNELVEPNDVPKRLADASFIHVPGNWQKAFPNKSRPLDATGIGTYYTKIILPQSVHEETNSIFSIYTQAIMNSGSVYINGEDIETIQTVNPNKNKRIGLRPTTFDFTFDGYTIDLVIHVQNDVFTPYGGIQKSVRFGSKNAIDAFTTFYDTLQLVTIVILFVHLMYAWVFIRISEQKKEVILYTLLIIFGVFTVALADSYLILHLVPLSFEWLIRLAGLAYLLICLIMMFFFKSIYPSLFRHALFWVINIINGITIISALALPFSLALYTYLMSYIIVTVTVIYLIFMIIKIISSRVVDSAILGLAIVSLASSAIWGVIYTFAPMNITYYPFDMIFALMVFAFFMMNRANRMSKEANLLTNQLKQANELKDFFIVSTTHELRNPLQSVINIIHHLITKSTLDQETDKQMRLVLSATNHMKITLNDFYDISLIQDGKLSLQKKAVSIQAITRGIIDMLLYSMDSKDIDIHMNIPDDFPSLYADESRLTQIMFNLIHNAIKFTDEGEVRIEATNHGDFATICIIDTGIGIPEALQHNIFEPYVHDQTTAARSGIGVGLTVSKQLVELHGGSIHVRSTINKGTEFSFTILISNEKASHLVQMDEQPSTRPDYTSNTQNMVQSLQEKQKLTSFISQSKILVVDDDPLNVEVISTILADDYQLTTAKNGEEALQFIANESFDLVIADVMMPNMSGYELTKRIREIYNISELPVLIFTARNLTEDIYTGFSTGANDYLTKPVNSVELQARVQSLLLLKYSVDQRLHFEAAWLQAQMKPHFLFNTIHSIISLSYIDHERMVHLLEMFSVYLRKSFQPLSADLLIPIEEELELIKAYLEIQKARFPERIHVNWDIQINNSFDIPPYSLQTIVENALSHGILKNVEGGELWISILHDDRGHTITVRDSGAGMSQEQLKEILTFTYGKQTGIGLINTNARLQKVFGTSLQINSKEKVGTTVSFTIPETDEQGMSE